MRNAFVIMAAIVLLLGCTSQPAAKDDSMMEKNDSMEKPDDKMEKPSDSMEKPGDTMEKPGDTMENGSMMEKPVGYVPFTKAAYEQARADGKIIFLEFYANWCPICAAQAPELEAAFKELKNPAVAAFRVNYKDSDTDADELALAREFGITYQHTHIILDSSGSVAKRSQENWNKAQIMEEVNKVTG